ncbi:LuxR C-terminal-related transcriptional regulator [Planotetraspora thailandica]
MRLRGFLSVMLGREGAVASLLKAALILSNSDPRARRDTLLEAFDAVSVVARIGTGMSALRVARAALDVPAVSDGPGEPDVADLLLAAHANLVAVGYVQAVPLMRRGLTAMQAEDAETGDAARWFLLGILLAVELWDIDALAACSERYSAAARRQGALRMLQAGAHGSATSELVYGRFAAAEAHFAEFKDVAAAISADLRFAVPSDVMLHAWRGDRDRTLAAVAAQAGPGAERPGGLQVQLARSALVLLELGHRRYAEAQAAGEIIFAEDPPHFGNGMLPDLVEAAVRNNDAAVARPALARLAERATASGTPWALGVLARSRALLASDDRAENLYLEAIGILKQTSLATELARAHLVYGEWLRRRRRRSDARDQLRTAHDMFVGMSAAAFAERARTELAATGERARRRDFGTAHDLTPQELRVAHLASQGATNQEIATELFISASTVEYHLRKVFRKLGVSSRKQLLHALPA